MSLRRSLSAALLGCCLVLAGPAARAVDLPPTCQDDPLPADDTTPIPELRRRVEAAAETDPFVAVRLLCATIPRVAREQGEDSVELAWWVGSLATPLIAYMDKLAEALPLLEFALPIFERKLGPDAPEVAEIHVAYAWIAFRQGRLADAGSAWGQVLRIRERVPGPKNIELQKALVGLAQVQLAQRDFAGARQSLEQAYGILEQNHETVSEAAAAIENAFTNLAIREEDFAGARRHAEAQIAIEAQLGGAVAQRVPAYSLLGQALERLDEFEESEKALREAVRLAESTDGPLQRHYIAALTLLGSMLNERGKPEEALPFAERAVEVGQASLGPDAPRLVRLLHNLAQVQRSLGRLPDALRQYELATAIVEAHRADIERQSLVAYYRGWGSLLSSLGETELARTTLGAGLEAAGDEPTLSTERAAVLLALAETSGGLDTPQCRAELEEALALFRARLPDTHPTLLRVIDGFCRLEIESLPEAAPHCEDAAQRLAASTEVEPGLREAVQENQSRLAERRGDPEAAYALAVRAVAAAAALGTPDPLWRAQIRIAHLLHERGETALAILFGKQAIAQIERLRGRFVGEDRRFDPGFLRDKIAVYRAVADWLMESGRIDEGLSILRLLKAEELYDFALRGAGWTAEERGVELTDGERSLWESYTKALDADVATGEELDRLSRLLEAGRISPTERERLAGLLAGQGRAEVARAERIREFIDQSESAPAPADAPKPVSQTARLERDLHELGPDTALAFYLLTETHLRVLVATPKAQVEVRTPVDAPALRRSIGEFLDRIARRADVGATSRALYDTLARPVDEAAQRSGAKRLVLWLDDALRYVPFGALNDGKRDLVEKYVIEILSGGEGTPASASTAQAGELRVRGLGVTQAVAGYEALPAVADELCYVVRGPITGLAEASAACPGPAAGNGALSGEGFADAAFTEARLDTLLDGDEPFSVLHVGTHFRLRPGNARRSFLVLGDGSQLTLDKIGALDFSGIELLTLSSCQTGLGGAIAEDGREVDGLSALVQRRGARRVVASLWHVEDASTAQLMRSMYRALGSGPLDVPRALQRAQLALRATRRDGGHPYEHPYYWAGFVVTGRP